MLRRVLRGRVPRASDTGLRQARLGSREAYGARTGRERRSALSASDPASETAATLRAARPGIERLAKYSRFDRGRWRARTRLNELPVMGTARSRLGSACAATSEHAGRARCDAVRRHAPVEFAELRPRSLMSRKRPPGGNVVPSVRAPHRLPSGRPLAAEACRASGSLQKRSLLASSITPQTRSRRAHPAMLDGALRGASAGKPRRWWCKWFAKMSAARTRGGPCPPRESRRRIWCRPGTARRSRIRSSLRHARSASNPILNNGRIPADLAGPLDDSLVTLGHVDFIEQQVDLPHVTCPRTLIQPRLEPAWLIRRLARLEQRAIGGAGRGCAADRPLR